MKLSSEVIKIIDLGLESYAKDMYLEKLDFCENIHSEIRSEQARALDSFKEIIWTKGREIC